jgi:hypothetical protein
LVLHVKGAKKRVLSAEEEVGEGEEAGEESR